jgi:peptide/nickel transport system permease protein
MSTIAWTRRRRAFQRSWADYRRDREGLIGLVVLAVFVGMALFASVIADPEDLRAITAEAKDYPQWAPPSEFAPLGTDSLGRPIWDQLIYGSQVSLLIGIAATFIAIVIGTVVGVTAGFFGG